MKHIYTLILSITSCLFAFAQQTSYMRLRCDSSYLTSNIADIIALPNGNTQLLVTNGSTLHLVEVDPAGNKVVNYGFTSSMILNNTAKCVITPSGNYGIISSGISSFDGLPYLTTLEVNPLGLLVSEKSVQLTNNTSGYNSIYETMRLKKDNQNNIYVTASFYESGYVFKFDQNLALQWQFTMTRDTDSVVVKLPNFDIEFDGDTTFYLTAKDNDSLAITRMGISGTVLSSGKLTDGNYRRGKDILRAADGSLYMCGYGFGYNPDGSYGGFGILMKFDQNLNIVFEKRYTSSMNVGLGFKEMLIHNNEIHLVGADEWGKVFFAKLDMNGSYIGCWQAVGSFYSANYQQEPIGLTMLNNEEVLTYYSDYTKDGAFDGNVYCMKGNTLYPENHCNWSPFQIVVTDATNTSVQFTSGHNPKMVFTTPVMNSTGMYDDYLATAEFSDPCIASGIHEIDRSNLSVFPNPCSDVISVANESGSAVTVSITGIDGTRLMSVRSQDQLIKLPVMNLASGMYVITVVDQNNVIRTTKIAVQ